VLWLKFVDEGLNGVDKENGVQSKEWSAEAPSLTDAKYSTRNARIDSCNAHIYPETIT
jgi:hypothetical protein